MSFRDERCGVTLGSCQLSLLYEGVESKSDRHGEDGQDEIEQSRRPGLSVMPRRVHAQIDQAPLPNQVKLVFSLGRDPLLDPVFPAKHLDHTQSANGCCQRLPERIERLPSVTLSIRTSVWTSAIATVRTLATHRQHLLLLKFGILLGQQSRQWKSQDGGDHADERTPAQNPVKQHGAQGKLHGRVDQDQRPVSTLCPVSVAY